MVRPRRELALGKIFLAPRILTLEELSRKLDASRSTILRRLDEHSYYSSYNHSGRFFTIAEVAEFDSRGLWSFKAARFSKHGNLKEPLEYFVNSSEAGLNHPELATLLALAGPLFGILGMQVVITIAFSIFVLFPLMGGTYRAAVLGANAALLFNL